MHKNGKITAPVSINDVRVTIGNSSHDLGTLCTSNNINKYSRYKPYNRGILTDDILEDRVTPINYGEMDKPKYWNYDMTPKQRRLRMGTANESYQLSFIGFPKLQPLC